MLTDDERRAYIAAQAKRKGRAGADDEMMFRAGIAYAQKWRGMESAPKDGTEVLLLWDVAVEIGYWHHDRWRGTTPRQRAMRPDGWLPLPPMEVK